MDLGISGKLAVVTGATAGMGLAVCETLAAEGVNLLLFARTEARLEQTQAELRRRFGVQVGFAAGDTRRHDDVRKLARAAEELGGPDILVLNTGRHPGGMREFLEHTDDDQWEQAYRIQLEGALFLLREITPLIIRKGWGRVVAINSASVKQPMPRHAISTVFRAGVIAALKHLANETAASGVTVNAVCPGSILTENFAAHNNVEARRNVVAMGRLGTPQEIAAAVAFFASHQAGFITGNSLQVDGGMTMALI